MLFKPSDEDVLILLVLMAVKEILELENNRDSSTLGKIYFYKEGNSPWYRAYELSAYFASFYDNGLDDKKRKCWFRLL